MRQISSAVELNPAVIKHRLRIIVVVFIVFGLALAAKLLYLQLFLSGRLGVLADSQQTKRWEIPAKRGKIYIQDGKTTYPIALNETVQLLYVDPYYIKDKKKFARVVSKILNIKERDLLKEISTNNRYVVIDPELNDQEEKAINALNMPGVVLKDRHRRVYPEGKYLSHILGFTDQEGNARYGIEEVLHNELMGDAGQVRAKTDRNGVPILTSDNIAKEAIPGADVYLTIDRNIQNKLEETLANSVTKFKARGGSVIVYEPKTGKVMGLANYPGFNPNSYAKVKNYEVFENFAYSRVYEPGSVFKIFTMAMGLDSGAIEPSTRYVDTGSVKVDEHTIRNSDRKRHGIKTMSGVLEDSLNTGTTWVLQQVGGKQGKINTHGERVFYDYLKKFGFGDESGVETNLESRGFISKPLTVSRHTYATMTFGQSISVTPIQLAAAVGAIANEGVLMKPYTVERIEYRNGKSKETRPIEVRQVISDESAAKLKAMMVGVVERGHGKKAGVKGYRVAGKTGTAQIPRPGGGYYEHANTGSFVGFAPAQDPRFVIIVKIDRPQIAWAESSAAPTFGEIASFLVRYLKIPPSK